MVKRRFIMIYNVNIFTMYESLLKNIIKVLPIIYQSKTKNLEESNKFRVQLQRELSSINCAQAI